MKEPIEPDMRPRKAVDTETFKGRFAVRLKTLRERKGLSVADVSEATGIPPTTLYDWEKARFSPTVEDLPKLAEALEIKVRTLLPEA